MQDNDKPQFLSRDTGALVQDMVADLESITGKTLHPAQPERLFINWMAYRLSLHREQVQDAALLNLVRFSRDRILDELAADRGESRLPAFAAGAVLSFTIPAPVAQPFLLPAGTLVATGSGNITLATVDNATLPAGQQAVTVSARAVDAGSGGNGYLPGQISQLVSILPGAPAGLAVSNTTVTDGGAEAETDERLQQRLLLSFDKYSVAGPAPAYRYMAMRLHPDIIDVAVVSHTPGEVSLYPLLGSGAAGQTVLDVVQRGALDKAVRVLCDTIRTLPPPAQSYRVRATLTLKSGDRADDVMPLAQQAVQRLAASMSTVLGGDIVPSHFTAVLQPLVHRVELQEPLFTACADWYWRRCTAIDLTIVEGA